MRRSAPMSVTLDVVGYGGCMEEPRGIVFRDGPTGSRAALVDGPDVWEICWVARQLGSGEKAVDRLVEDFSLTPGQVAAALRYAVEFPAEIEARIDLHRGETAGYQVLADV